MNSGEGGSPRAAGASPPRGGRRRLLLLGGVALGAGAGLLVLLSDPTPVLDLASLERARSLWSRRGASDYDITVVAESDARPLERFRTEVRGGKAIRLLRNGQPVDLRDAYTVVGLFAIIAREVEMAAARQPGAASGAPRGARLKARFHETLGAPMVFKRLAPGRLSLVINVERLETPAGEPLSPGP
jgi:hypothetical protein